MEVKRQIFHAEFQIIYIWYYTVWVHFSPPKHQLHRVPSSQRAQCRKKEKRISLQWRNLTNVSSA